MNEILLIYTSVPDAATANAIARALIESRLAACVSAGSTITSTYRWQGKIEQADEIALQVKTTANRHAEAQELIRAMHPYELPEIIAVPVVQGLPAYLDWIIQETR